MAQPKDETNSGCVQFSGLSLLGLSSYIRSYYPTRTNCIQRPDQSSDCNFGNCNDRRRKKSTASDRIILRWNRQGSRQEQGTHNHDNETSCWIIYWLCYMHCYTGCIHSDKEFTDRFHPVHGLSLCVQTYGTWNDDFVGVSFTKIWRGNLYSRNG